ncbi:predicted protein [Naegleria gruberi]|uniref:Predicted protein n=1 Tax=Naegleria gruberi TaxID=5762 RepID=D2VXX8_NAEGR|nr:uncharacterized protein NAEGRDRAFT_73996 [Naegleria gruberi]EFC38273.1 predicted protein [Naegleria gruberi]|eukprot:XP_002671017.1 predicted protein [Naegleria gruberi strain NEG-M]
MSRAKSSDVFLFGLICGFVLSAPTFLLACKYFKQSPLLICPVTSASLGFFFSAAYQWEWGIGWPTGLGCTCAITLNSLGMMMFTSDDEFGEWISLIAYTVASGLIGSWCGAQSQ